MFKINHQKARLLIQKATDNILKPDEKPTLDIHLESCSTCREYAKSLNNVEVDVKRVLHTRWDYQHPKLDPKSIIEATEAGFKWINLFNPTHVIGRATIIVTVLLGYFIIADLFGNQYPIIESETPTIIPTPGDSSSTFTISPTPSMPSNQIELTTQACKYIIHIIQIDDTLDSIALQFKVSKDLITMNNSLNMDDLSPGHKLTIPVCVNTPSQTPINTMASTPLIITAHPTQHD